MNTYKAFYKGKSIDLEAISSYDAQQKAAKLMKAKKAYEVTIMLLSVGERIIIHSTSAF